MDFFINGDWRYENKKILTVFEKMSPQARKEFNCDSNSFEWPEFLTNYVKGLSIWALGEDQVEPIHGFDQIVRKNKKMFDDLKFAMKPRLNFKIKST